MNVTSLEFPGIPETKHQGIPSARLKYTVIPVSHFAQPESHFITNIRLLRRPRYGSVRFYGSEQLRNNFPRYLHRSGAIKFAHSISRIRIFLVRPVCRQRRAPVSNRPPARKRNCTFYRRTFDSRNEIQTSV